MINQKFIDSLFPDIIGQNRVKGQLAFYMNSFRSTQLLPNLLIIGGKGSGKTELATRIARSLSVKELGGKVKSMVKVNCATVRRLESLMENVIIPYNKDHVTFFFDECHALDELAQDALLTALNQDKSFKGYMNYKDSRVEFDFKKVSFVFATTDPQKMTGPLKDRLRVIQLEPYTTGELSEIIKVNLPSITVSNEALALAGSACRGNPRQSVKMAQENIMQYCGAAGITHFDEDAWFKMKALLGINDLGVGEGELQIMRALEGYASRSLTAVAAATGLEKSAVQNEFETYLLKMGLMEVIQGGRRLTLKGKNYLKNVDNNSKSE